MTLVFATVWRRNDDWIREFTDSARYRGSAANAFLARRHRGEEFGVRDETGAYYGLYAAARVELVVFDAKSKRSVGVKMAKSGGSDEYRIMWGFALLAEIFCSSTTAIRTSRWKANNWSSTYRERWCTRCCGVSRATRSWKWDRIWAIFCGRLRRYRCRRPPRICRSSITRWEIVVDEGWFEVEKRINAFADGSQVLIAGDWSPWANRVPQIEVETHKVAAPDVVVPTLDTVRHESLLYTWLAEHKPIGDDF